jgi:hypothetical protein
MSRPRQLAAFLLRAALRLAPRQSRDWAAAMLRELDFIDGEWTALFWALGSMAAILRHSAGVVWAWLKRKTNEEVGMNTTGKKALGVTLGIVSALMLVGCAFAVLRIIGLLFPSLNHSPWAYWIAVLALPEAAFVAATILLWRERGPIAAGVLATGLVIALHIGVHLALR